MNIQQLTALRKYITIKNHTDGHIKIQFSMQILADQNAMSLIKEQKGNSLPSAIHKTSFNLFTRSLQMDYDTAIIVPQELTEMLTTTSKARFEELTTKYKNILSA